MGLMCMEAVLRKSPASEASWTVAAMARFGIGL
jgi:hypothetical protein